MSTTPRPPLLSDEELQTMSGHGEMTSWEKYVGEAVRDFYEHLITDGKLREAMMVVVVQPDPLVPMWSCSLCDWRNAPSHYTYCPGCGNKIKR